MPPHAERTSSDLEGAVTPDFGQRLHQSSAEAFTPAVGEATPLRNQLSALYEDNIAAKIIKAAVNGLVNNVGLLERHTVFAVLTI